MADAGGDEQTKPNVHRELAAVCPSQYSSSSLVATYQWVALSHLFPNAAVSGTETNALDDMQPMNRCRFVMLMSASATG